MASRNFAKLEDLIAGTTEDLEGTIYGPDKKTPLAIAANDEIRFKLFDEQGGELLLEISSIAATDNGSVVTITDLGDADAGEPAAFTVRLAQGDTEDLAGEYWAIALLVDDSETSPADAIKPICSGLLTFLAAPGGELGLT